MTRSLNCRYSVVVAGLNDILLCKNGRRICIRLFSGEEKTFKISNRVFEKLILQVHHHFKANQGVNSWRLPKTKGVYSWWLHPNWAKGNLASCENSPHKSKRRHLPMIQMHKTLD